jgi:hypothetical protein
MIHNPCSLLVSESFDLETVCLRTMPENLPLGPCVLHDQILICQTFLTLTGLIHRQMRHRTAKANDGGGDARQRPEDPWPASGPLEGVQQLEAGKIRRVCIFRGVRSKVTV